MTSACGCSCCTAIVGMVSVVSTTAQTAITAIAAIAGLHTAAKQATMRPDISVVMPAHNKGARLAATIDSIASGRTTARVEIIIADDKSTDDAEAHLCGGRTRAAHRCEEGSVGGAQPQPVLATSPFVRAGGLPVARKWVRIRCQFRVENAMRVPSAISRGMAPRGGSAAKPNYREHMRLATMVPALLIATVILAASAGARPTKTYLPPGARLALDLPAGWRSTRLARGGGSRPSVPRSRAGSS